jgi:hypothetical protein
MDWLSFLNIKKRKVTAELKGGLGNQLFQIAAVLNYAKSFNFKPVFTNKKQLHERDGDVGGFTYWHIFNTTNLLNLEPINESDYRGFYEEQFNYTPLFKIKKNAMLKGYFQSPKYVTPVRKEMLDLLWSNEDVSQKVNTAYQSIKDKFSTENLISVHIRRGDYLNLSTYHNNLEIEYYVNAINQLPEPYPIIVFSNDQDWCKKELSQHIKNEMYFVALKDYEELLLMSKIKNNIIANSSFSWWSTYLNTHKDKVTIAPKIWFGPEGIKDWSDIYDTDWIIL